MFEENLLIEKLIFDTGYEVRYLENNLFENVNFTGNNPIIYVGHVGINLRNPNDLTANSYEENDNNEILITSICFVCSREDFCSVREKIKQSYSGWSPFPYDSNYSSVVFMQGRMRASVNNIVWWEEQICLHMPRIS